MNSDETKNIKAVFILEIVGRPPEHLKETLEKLVKQMKEEKGMKIENTNIKDPVPMKDQKDFYTTFAEVEIEFEDVLKMMFMVFKYMPAHVEVSYPEKIQLTNDGLGLVLNELTRRLHGYDEIARVIQMEKKILEKKLRSVLDKNPKKETKKEEKK
jgi:hypothetical protein